MASSSSSAITNDINSPFVCKRCLTSYDTVPKLIAHLSRKKVVCVPVSPDHNYDKASLIVEIRKIENKRYKCKHCAHCYSFSSSRAYHEKTCVHQGIINGDDATQIVGDSNVLHNNTTTSHDLHDTNVSNAQHAQHSTIVTGNTNTHMNNTTNNITNNTINVFKKEDTSYISIEDIIRCVNCEAGGVDILAMIQMIFTNVDHPENHTVKYKNLRENQMLVHVGNNKWEVDHPDSIAKWFLLTASRQMFRLERERPEFDITARYRGVDCCCIYKGEISLGTFDPTYCIPIIRSRIFSNMK
jgi:hypothetical protein